MSDTKSVRINKRTKRAIETIKRGNQLTAIGIVDNAVNIYSKLLAADSQDAEIIIKWPSKENTRILLP